MKKTVLTTALLLFSMSFQTVFAEESLSTSESQSEVSTTTLSTEEQSVNSSEDETVSTKSSLSSEQIPTENLSDETILSSIENNPIVKEYTTSPAAVYTKGDTLNPNDFKAYLEQMSGLTLTNLTFSPDHNYTTETLQLNDAQLTGTDSEGNSYLFIVKYLVKNNVPTLRIWDVYYDQATNTLSGKKSLGADLYFYPVGLETAQPIFVYTASGTEDFSFQPGPEFGYGRLISIIAYSPAAVEYSDPYLFKLPLANTSTSSNEDNNIQADNQKTDNPAPKQDLLKKKELPSTGEQASMGFTLLGGIILVEAAYLFHKKRLL